MKKMGRLICLLVGLSTIQQAQAGWQFNWLAGFSGGWARHNSEYNIRSAYTALPILGPTYIKEAYRDAGSIWEVFLGYQASNYDWLFGAELTFGWYPHNHHERLFSFTDNYNALLWYANESYHYRPTIGLSGRIGYKMTPVTLSYLRVGLETSRDRLVVIINGDPTINPLQLSQELTHQQLRSIWGIGIETPLTFLKRTTLRIEYNYHLPFTRLTTSGTIFDGFINPSFVSDTKPKTQMIKAALVWNGI